MFKCIPKRGQLFDNQNFHFSCSNAGRSATSGTVAQVTASLIPTKIIHSVHSVTSKSCTFLTSFLYLGYPVCKILSLFWSTSRNSYTRLQWISCSCRFITNSNLWLAPTLSNSFPGKYEQWRPRRGESPHSPEARRPHRATAKLAIACMIRVAPQSSSSAGLEDMSWSAWWPQVLHPAPQIPPWQGVQHAIRPFPVAAPATTGGHSRTTWHFPGEATSGVGSELQLVCVASVFPQYITLSWEHIRRVLLLKIILIPWKAPS